MTDNSSEHPAGDFNDSVGPEEIPYAGILKAFEPELKDNLMTVKFENKTHFPDDDASRWMLGLLVARNDLGISLKLQVPFAFAPEHSDPNRALYRLSHSVFFWRLTMAQLYEAWIAFNKKAAYKNPLIDAVCVHPTVAAAHAAVIRLFDVEAEGDRPQKFLDRCRAVTYHYYDDKSDSWAEQLKIINPSQPAMLCPESGVAVDTRYIIADEYLMSRLNLAGIWNKKLHSSAIREMTKAILTLIDSCMETYVDARTRKTADENSPSSIP